MSTVHLPGQAEGARGLYGVPEAADAAAQAAVRAHESAGQMVPRRAARAYARDDGGRAITLYLARGTGLNLRPGQMAAYGFGRRKIPRVDQLGPQGRAGRQDKHEVQR